MLGPKPAPHSQRKEDRAHQVPGSGVLAARNAKRPQGAFFLAERVGFEPTLRQYRKPDFESGAFDHSATSPGIPELASGPLMITGHTRAANMSRARAGVGSKSEVPIAPAGRAGSRVEARRACTPASKLRICAWHRAGRYGSKRNASRGNAGYCRVQPSRFKRFPTCRLAAECRWLLRANSRTPSQWNRRAMADNVSPLRTV